MNFLDLSKVAGLILRVVLAVVVGSLAAACGSAATRTGTASSSAAARSPRANTVDRAFVREIVPEHTLAVALATLGRSRAEHPQIKALAATIVGVQDAQIATMQGIAKALGVELQPGRAQARRDAAVLGVPVHDRSSSASLTTLSRAKPFDRAFIDVMVAQHRSAIPIARAEFARGVNPNLQLLASDIVVQQEDEIRELNAWRTRWYGRPSPAGGVPSE